MAKHRMPPMGGMGGMANMNNMITQAQKMQQDMLKMQSELEEAEFEATSGGGAVTVVVTGKKEVKSVKINPDVIDPDDAEMLEDMVVAAVNEAIKKSVDAMESAMESAKAGLGGLGGLGGLF